MPILVKIVLLAAWVVVGFWFFFGTSKPKSEKENGDAGTSQNSSGANSPNIVANNSQVNITYSYANPTSDDPEVVRLVKLLDSQMARTKAELMSRFPYGFTMLGLSGTIFTAVDYENSIFALDAETARIEVTSKKDAIVLHGKFKKLKETEATKNLMFSVVAGMMPFFETNAMPNGMSVGGIGPHWFILDRNPSSPVLVIGFRRSDPKMQPALEDVLRDIRKDIKEKEDASKKQKK
jgi:hypothetical protein